ncbi:60 kDa chaperonin [Frankliniella fusca]|uniref:60 kDa chaperonin n=1 Tax=Frankliniella fusca TaxID=407009 RepID=A0AAE1LL75_9NEOP|nr:60 kDa chaperonin [Frankliniella fusca]
MSRTSRSKHCDRCERGHDKSDHDCRENWSGSSKAMEPDMAVEVVAKNKLLTSQNCNIGEMTMPAMFMLSRERESAYPVEKWSDISHIKRNLSNTLYALKLTDQTMIYIKKNFACLLEQNRNNVEATEDAPENLVPHIFGDHTSCSNIGSGVWCRYSEDPVNYKHSGLPHGKPLSNPTPKATLSKTMERYAKAAKKIAPGGSSQANESFNNIVCTKAPKYKYYGGSESFDFRLASAVLQKNEGTKYVSGTMHKLSLSPGSESAKVREMKDHKRSSRATLQKSKEIKKRRSELKKQKSSTVSAAERRKGITYSTGCDVEGITSLLQNPTVLTMAPYGRSRSCRADSYKISMKNTTKNVQILDAGLMANSSSFA